MDQRTKNRILSKLHEVESALSGALSNLNTNDARYLPYARSATITAIDALRQAKNEMEAVRAER